MRPILLQLDDALERQPRLSEAVAARGGRMLPARDLGPKLRLWTGPRTLRALRLRLAAAGPEDGVAELVFAGSGDFHHVTPVLLERALARFGGPVTLVHFDNHPDWARFAAGLHCGSWLGRAARLEGVAGVATIGVTSDDVAARKARAGDLALVADARLDVFAWAAPDGGDELRIGGCVWPTIAAMGEGGFLDALDRAIRTEAVYVSIDKDVLAPAWAVTNWDQGQASLDFLERALRIVLRGRRLVGADVVGDWSAPVYQRGPAGWLKAVEARLDQPRPPPPQDLADAINQAANLRLLEALAGQGA